MDNEINKQIKNKKQNKGKNIDLLSVFGFNSVISKDYKKNDNEISKPICFYRGHSDNSYLIQPSIIRTIKDECDMFSHIVRNHSYIFYELKPIEILTKMQHYEVPTRLLDVTTNSLVAAFFALSNLGFNNKNICSCEKCKKKIKDKKPEVIKFVIENEKLKNFNSDIIKILSVLPFLKTDDKELLRVSLTSQYIVFILCAYLIFDSLWFFDSYQEYEKIESFLEIQALLNNFLNDFFINLNESIDTKKFKYEKSSDIWNYYAISRNKTFNLQCTNKSKNISITLNNTINNQKFEFELKKVKLVKYTIPYFSCFFKTIKCKSDDGFFETRFKNNFHFFIRSNHNIIDEIVEAKKSKRIKPIDEIYYQIKQKYGVDFDHIKILDLLNGVFVTPIVSTDRMRAQQGAFMLFGLSRYWDIEKCILFLEECDCNSDEIIEFLMKNEPISESSLLKEKNINIKDFENYVFNINERYYLDNKIKVDDVVLNLKNAGIDKQTLGCSLQTTYYQYLIDNKDKVNESNN